ncbi:MAG: alpha/beta hydrolase, partial [Bacteroidetes bacterium]
LHALRELVSKTMTPTTFGAVRQPTFITYYDENDDNQDQIVSVAAIEQMIPLLGIPPDSLRVIANTTARTHPLACDLWNPNWQTVAEDTYQFAEQVLGLVPVDNLVVK